MRFWNKSRLINNSDPARTYDLKECETISRQLANAVKERISALNIKNYKIVCKFLSPSVSE
jgi:hypothetical protein